MRRIDTDIAIVGAGPAGGRAACALAESGLSLALIERAALPRPKACGGAMPQSARALVEADMATLVEAEIAGQTHLMPDGREIRHEAPDRPMILVDRARFDAALVAEARRLAGDRLVLLAGTAVTDAVEDGAGVTLHAGDTTVRARYVIAADGATSVVARRLGLYGPTAGAGIDVELRTTPEAFARLGRRSLFDMRCVRDGYGWVFPKAGLLSAGVGIWRAPSGLKPAMRRFLDGLLAPGEIAAETWRAHPVPVFTGHRPCASRRVCLAGDAAHLVDPVIGEGILYALESGRMAADTVAALCGVTLPPARGGIAAHPGYPATLAEIVAAHGDCRAYTTGIRHSLARKLNLIRLEAEGAFAAAPLPYAKAVPA